MRFFRFKKRSVFKNSGYINLFGENYEIYAEKTNGYLVFMNETVPFSLMDNQIYYSHHDDGLIQLLHEFADGQIKYLMLKRQYRIPSKKLAVLSAY